MPFSHARDLLPAHAISAVLLAGGRGSRMGGADKGLQAFRGTPLAQNALQRLRAQTLAPAHVAISANRHLNDYAALGAPVLTDPPHLPAWAGPLAGFLAGLAQADTPWLLTVPCDVPLFPLSLCERLVQAAQAQQADIAIASASDHEAAPSDDGPAPLRRQPVFCLLRTALHADLAAYVHEGGRKIGAWAARHRTAVVPFDAPGDDPLAFANANTLDELHRLEGLMAPATPPAQP